MSSPLHSACIFLTFFAFSFPFPSPLPSFHSLPSTVHLPSPFKIPPSLIPNGEENYHLCFFTLEQYCTCFVVVVEFHHVVFVFVGDFDFGDGDFFVFVVNFDAVSSGGDYLIVLAILCEFMLRIDGRDDSFPLNELDGYRFPPLCQETCYFNTFVWFLV